MKHVRSGISYCALIALMLGVLAPMGMMPASAQDLAATPVGDEPSTSITNTDGETDPILNDDKEIESADEEDPTNEPNNLLLPADVDWVVFGRDVLVEDPTTTPGSTISYWADITNHTTNPLGYQVVMWISGPASISIPEMYQTTYSCETFEPANMTTCVSTSQLGSFGTRKFTFDLVVDQNPSPEACSSPIVLDAQVEFFSSRVEELNESIPLSCPTNPHLAIEPIVLDSANQEKLSAAEIGDRLVLEVTLTNPHASPLTIGEFSTSSDAELHALNWTPGPTDAFATDGPCAIDQNGQVSCSNITLAASGQEGSSLTITLTSDPLAKSDLLCGQFSMSAAVTGGPSSGLANFDIACAPPLATLPQINLGTATCVGTTAMVPMTLSGGQHIQTPVISQNATTITPDGTGVYQIQSGVETYVVFTVPTEAEWPDPLPILFEGGQWIDDTTQPTFRFTPAELDCAPKLQITKTYWDRANNSVPTITSVAPGETFVFRVEVKNIGITTVTGLEFRDPVAIDLQWSTDGQVLARMTNSDALQCNVNAADFMRDGKIAGTRFLGPSCKLRAGSEIAPGGSVSFLYTGQMTKNPVTEQCRDGISDPAEITVINGIATTIQSNIFTVKPRCPDGSFVPLMTVKLNVTDGSSLEGAPWKLYAPVASQADLPIYDQGVVGAGNVIVFNKETPDGQYRLVIEPDGMPVINRIIDIRTDQAEMTLQIEVEQDEDLLVSPSPSPSPSPTVPVMETPTSTPGTSETPTAGGSETPIPTSDATSSPTQGATESGTVTGLPETGSGEGAGKPMFAFAVGMTLTFPLAIAGIRRCARN